MRRLDEQEARAFLAAGTRTGKLATVRADGRPHVVPIWYVFDGDDLVFTAWHESVKVLNMQRDARVALCADLEEPPYSYVTVEGTVTVVDDPEAGRYWATVIGGRYMGAERAEEFGRRNGVPGEYVVRLKPSKFIGYGEMTE